MINWDSLNRAINDNDSFLISSHQSLDGDCVGSMLAFMWYLRSRDKLVDCYCTDPLPQPLAFLKDSELITQNKPAGNFDVLMILDCSNLQRIGWNSNDIAAKMIINIDHHRDNTNFGGLNFIDAGASAAGEIILDFFKQSNVNIPRHVAEALYAAVMTDTGGFRFSNTTARVLRDCAELAELGADCADIYEKVYSSHTREGLALRAYIWSTLKYYLNGKVCGMDMPMSKLDELGAVYPDAEGMADYTVTATGVEVGIMTKHTPKETHFSLRSTGNIDVGKLAKTVAGGGGHSCAAGCTINLPYEQAMEQMLLMLSKELQNIK